MNASFFKKYKSVLLVCLSVLILQAVSVVTHIFSGLNTAMIPGYIINFLICLAICVAACFLKERHLRSMSVPLYFLVALIFLLKQFRGAFGYFPEYFTIGEISLFLPALVPLMIPYLTTEIKSAFSTKKVDSIYFHVIIFFPLFFIWYLGLFEELYLASAILFVLLFFYGNGILRWKSWSLIVIPALTPVVATLVECSKNSTALNRVVAVLTRGANIESDHGYIRRLLDDVLLEGKMLSALDMKLTDGLGYKLAGYYNIAHIINEFGWLALLGVIAVYVVLFVNLFAMVKKTNQSSFAKSVSFTMAMSLLIQAVYSVAAFLFFDDIQVPMPFLTPSRAYLLVNMLAVAVVFLLYKSEPLNMLVKEKTSREDSDTDEEISDLDSVDDFDGDESSTENKSFLEIFKEKLAGHFLEEYEEDDDEYYEDDENFEDDEDSEDEEVYKEAKLKKEYFIFGRRLLRSYVDKDGNLVMVTELEKTEPLPENSEDEEKNENNQSADSSEESAASEENENEEKTEEVTAENADESEETQEVKEETKE